jgi:catechol 2,3-dioxygenase-like lactoylglutathione lyase family enzyme
MSVSKVLSIEHVQLAMPEGHEDAAREFYERLLGIPEVPKPGHLAKRGGVWFERDGLKVHLGVDPNFSPATKAHPAFVVENLLPLAAKVTEAGYETIDGSVIGWLRVYVRDPFGNRIELLEPRS